MTLNREKGRAAVHEISSFHPFTEYEVDNEGRLHVRVPGGLLAEQRTIILQYKEEIIEYLTTAPTWQGACHRGHMVTWGLHKYGNWLCTCYFNPPATEDKAPIASPATASIDVSSAKTSWHTRA